MKTTKLSGRILAGLALGGALLAGCSIPRDEIASGEAYAVEDDGALVRLPPMIARSLTAEDKDDEHAFAESTALSLTPTTIGVWDAPRQGVRRWRLAIEREGALSLNFGFTRFRMPRGGVLRLLDAEGRAVASFGDEHNKAHGELWTPIVRGIRAAIEVTVPAGSEERLDLALTRVGSAFKDFTPMVARSGDCNRDVVCADGDAWRDEIRSVGVISLGGQTMCTGTLVNDAAGDQRPFFLTARHCRVSATNAASLVVYWNYESTTCGGPADGRLEHFQTGSVWRAARDVTDFTLVELDDDPLPEHRVYWSGWDARPNVPTSAVAIHHPRTDEKRISFENDPLTVSSYLSDASPGNGSHLRVADWDVGTTEPGSSGSGLWNQDHRLVGQLHGGYAACGNDRPDWYGWFAMSWDAGATPAERLRDWLDPGGDTERFVDGRNACSPPTVDFTTSAAAATVGERVTLRATATGGQGPYTYAWDLDDDGVVDCTGPECLHAWDREFDGSVSLTVTDQTGCRAKVRHRQVVDDPGLCPRSFDARDVPLAIPDQELGGVESAIAVHGAGTARKARVSFRVEHTYIGDLRVALITPSGRQVMLHRNEGGATNDLVVTDHELAGLEGEPIEGTWRLRAIDSSPTHRGQLASWRLTLRTPCGAR